MKRRSSTIWVNMHDYKWAVTRWPTREVCIDTYLWPGDIRITKPGYLFNKKRKRLIKVDDETFKRETKGASITTTHPRLVPKRGS